MAERDQRAGEREQTSEAFRARATQEARQHGPHARRPLAHETGEAPPGQVTSHGLRSLHETWHEPRHSTTQLETLLQVIMLPEPALTPQRSTFSH
jgi:hypothetical protein